MKIQQISVFLENKSGRLSAVTRALGEADINIRALSIADTSDFGILRLIVDKPQKAYQLLQDGKFAVSMNEVIGVEVSDSPGGLADVLDLIDDEKINLEYLYAFIGRTAQDAYVIFRVDDVEKAITVLQANDIRLLKGEEIYTL